MTEELSKRLVPDELWVLAEPLLPKFTPRAQGAGTTPTDERAVSLRSGLATASARMTT
ncbi:hypothetical protein AB0M12_10920 [Nocardia vinacea]|uniref:hypothetical protein n=1 Tax=Nocardia vinacea TaxID=96468 RepID=UPI003421E190